MCWQRLTERQAASLSASALTRRFLLQQCTFEHHAGSKNNRSTIRPRYPEAENPFRAQLERVESIRHFLGRQAANNPSLCPSEESLPMCFPETPPCQSRKVSSSSVMEKHAAKYSWGGGSKKVAIWILWKMKALIGLGWACEGMSEICVVPQRGSGMYRILEQWLGQESGSSEFGSSELPACFQTGHSTFLSFLE